MIKHFNTPEGYSFFTKEGYPNIKLADAIKVIFPHLVQLKTNKEVMDHIRQFSDELKDRWNSSGQTDYTIYTDPLYLYEAFISYFEVSRECHKVIAKWVQDFDMDPKKLSFFDLYNGVGLGTLHLVALGFKTTIHNDNPEQSSAMFKLFDHYNLKPPRLIDESWRNEKFDFVSAFEVIEHFKDPIQITKDLAACVKPGGLLVESTGFQVNTYPGHFKEYEVEGEKIDSKTASRFVAKTLKAAGLKKIYVGFNKKPRIWQRV